MSDSETDRLQTADKLRQPFADGGRFRELETLEQAALLAREWRMSP